MILYIYVVSIDSNSLDLFSIFLVKARFRLIHSVFSV